MSRRGVLSGVKDPGVITYIGDYISPEIPLWLSAFGPTPGPGNVAVSSLTTSAPGFIAMQASTINNVSTANQLYAPIIFDRAPNNAETFDSQIGMNVSHLVPNIAVDTPFLTVSANAGIDYDDLAVRGIQLFGNQSTDPTTNTGCIGVLTGTPAVGVEGELGATPASISLITPGGGSFNTSTINTQTLTVTGTFVVNTGNFSTINTSTINANVGNYSTIIGNIGNFSTINTSTITGNVGNFSSINTSTIIAGTAQINSLSTNVQTTNQISYGLNGQGIQAVDGVSTRIGIPNSIFRSAGYGVDITDTIVSTIGTAPGPGVGMLLRRSFIDNTSTATTFLYGNTLVQRNFNASSINCFGITASNITTNQIVATSTITASTINSAMISTGIIDAPLINVSTIFTNTMNFNPAVSPEVDLGLGGIVGGLVGGASANVFNTALGLAALGTGIAGLTMPRTSGGLATNTFQTYAGTSQIQFSTLGNINTFSQSTSTAFLTTTNGIGNFGSTISTSSTIPAGSWAFRTVSDPINLATNTGAGATSTIQAASQWVKVFPGSVSMGNGNNNIITQACQNFIDMGGSVGSPLTIQANFPQSSGDFPPSDPTIQINPITQLVIGGGSTLSVNKIINVDTMSVNTLQVLRAISTLNVNTNNISTNALSVNLYADIHGPIDFNRTGGTNTGEIYHLSTINGLPYPPTAPFTPSYGKIYLNTDSAYMSANNVAFVPGSLVTTGANPCYFNMNALASVTQPALFAIRLGGYSFGNGGNQGNAQVGYSLVYYPPDYVQQPGGNGMSKLPAFVNNQVPQANTQSGCWSTFPFYTGDTGIMDPVVTPITGAPVSQNAVGGTVMSPSMWYFDPVDRITKLFLWVYINTSGALPGIKTVASGTFISWRRIL